MNLRLATAAALIPAALFAIHCTPEKLPGDVVVGTFRFEAKFQQENCRLADAGLDLEPFVGTVSMSSDAGTAYLTVNGTDHVGSLENGLLRVVGSGERRLPPPFESDAGPCSGQVEEQIVAQMLGEAETLRLGGNCPPLPRDADGGVLPPEPPAATPDGGQPGDAGLDVRLVCGSMTDSIKPAQSTCAAPECQVIYSLKATRQ